MKKASQPHTLRHLSVVLAIASIATLAACNKSERIPTTEERLKAVQNKQETQPDFFIARKSVDYTADLKSIRETPKTEAAARPEPVKPEPTKVAQAETRQAPAPAPAPVVAAPAPAPVQQAPAPAAQPVAQAPAPAPRPATPTADTSVTVVNREQPNFPREAVRQGVESGSVRARVTITASGDVGSVSIISARPPRIFDREVQQTLQRWKFNQGAEGRTYETEIAFQR